MYPVMPHQQPVSQVILNYQKQMENAARGGFGGPPPQRGFNPNYRGRGRGCRGGARPNPNKPFEPMTPPVINPPKSAEEIHEIDLWVAQRRKNWPSAKRVQEKQEK